MSALNIAAPKPSFFQESFTVLSTGFALFSMFFGAGNIIFPLVVGRMAGSEVSSAIWGLGISAVIFPFLGLFAMMLYAGNIHQFLSRMGKWTAPILLFVLQMSQGPAGSIPRLVTLMHATVKTYLPGMSLFSFSIGICLLVFYLSRRPNKLIGLLGVWLTPALLIALGALVFSGISGAPDAPIAAQTGAFYFGQGLKLGYQTTDLIAALLFATIILPHLSQGNVSPQTVRRRMTYSSLIASLLLMVVYIGLCWISARYSAQFANLPPEELLQNIATLLLGSVGTFLASIAVFLACLTTAISLSAVFSQYIETDLLKSKLSREAALGITLGFAAALANLGFSGIVKLWGPILDVLYPALIVLCVFNIGHRLYSIKQVNTPVFFVLGLTIGSLCF